MKKLKKRWKNFNPTPFRLSSFHRPKIYRFNYKWGGCSLKRYMKTSNIQPHHYLRSFYNETPTFNGIKLKKKGRVKRKRKKNCIQDFKNIRRPQFENSYF